MQRIEWGFLALYLYYIIFLEFIVISALVSNCILSYCKSECMIKNVWVNQKCIYVYMEWKFSCLLIWYRSKMIIWTKSNLWANKSWSYLTKLGFFLDLNYSTRTNFHHSEVDFSFTTYIEWSCDHYNQTQNNTRNDKNERHPSRLTNWNKLTTDWWHLAAKNWCNWTNVGLFWLHIIIFFFSSKWQHLLISF